MTGYGDNRPPLIDPDQLALDNGDLSTRAAQLLEAEARLPDSLTEETVGKVADFARQIKACMKTAEDRRKVAKDPFLDAGRTVDGWFGALTAPLLELVQRVEARVGAFLKAKEAEARAAREAEARRLAAEAAELAKAGDKDQAREVRGEARAVRKEAETARPADLTRMHTGMGGVASLKAPIAHEITNKRDAVCELWELIDDDAVDKAVRAWVRDHHGIRGQLELQPRKQPLAGVRLYIDRKVSIR